MWKLPITNSVVIPEVDKPHAFRFGLFVLFRASPDLTLQHNTVIDFFFSVKMLPLPRTGLEW